ncbi:uncharacterized protein LOC134666457 [Cydia fagiglandana]|uniref:uncharacterized protein LOC134666457 n=1 Tax=Cydia fagiglandana TaxID=1458189 RepID=UPI002FEE1BDB
MEQEPQVFSSNITRSSKPLKNDLTLLLKVTPAQPIEQKKYEKRNTCDFIPKTGKTYEPKRKSKFKVSTVRDVRHLFEKDVYSTLLIDLEKQQNVLLRKIKAGSARDENTKTITRNIFKSDKPVSRSAWQMLTNLNPEEYAHPTQFVLWNGKRIRVNGSRGGSCKFLCKYDLAMRQFPKKAKSPLTRKPLLKKKGLLQNSLSVNFKPGPLRKKIFLDHSYQKYHVGGIELQNLPKPALEINPTVGKTIDPTIAHYLQNMREEDGTITEKWAEFSVSVLATVKNEIVTQIESECCVTFDLNYKRDQQQILMRRDVNNELMPSPLAKIIDDSHCYTHQDSVVTSEIQSLLNQIIDSVEISLEQDNMYTGEDEPRDVKSEETTNVTTVIQPKETRLKRKCGELERLDVTIIRLTENNDRTSHTCPKACCSMGCVCSSLECGYNFQTHCGRTECMFECKCDFSKYKVVDSFERDCSNLLPGLLKLDSEMSSKLAKEEQKFHHTVIVTPENSMLLKSKRRDWKSSRKYAEFFSNMSLKSGYKPEKVAELVIEKLNLPNVEPWCMVHGLYKCFCKCIFTDNSLPEVKTDEVKENNGVNQHNDSVDLTDDVEPKPKPNLRSIRARMPSHRNINDKNPVKDKPIESLETDCAEVVVPHWYSRSARVKAFTGRKFSDGYYFNANRKISEMEQHDKSLRKRLEYLYHASTSNQGQLNSSKVMESVPTPSTPLPTKSVPTGDLLPTLPPLPPLTSAPTIKPTSTTEKALNTKINLYTNRLPDKKKLVAWLEVSYKQYKQRINSGIVKISLEPPHLGKMALYPWEFILGRYRDRKNLFLITTKLPYRLFMAVDPQNPFFRHCININDIRFADLPKYPVTVKNLLANANDLKDNFCILWGLSHCWELIGSVTKVCNQEGVNESIQLSDETDEELKNNTSEVLSDSVRNDSEDSNATVISLGQYRDEENTSSDKTIDENHDTSSDDSSRWFVMTVENDFEEIQFYNKGFFVKLESIIKAIDVARASKKTVRLSSQKCADNSTGPQFGIYAIPNENEPCVFVGPYEKGESLGIETVKNMSDIRKQRRTKGVWITTKKLENFNVIDNPLSFMPSRNASETEMMTLAGVSTNTEKGTDSFVAMLKGDNKLTGQNAVKQGSTETHNSKILKPIKICKTNSFYQLAPNGTLKQISPQHSNEQSQVCIPTTIQPRVISTPTSIQPKVINASLLKRSDSGYAPLLKTTSILKSIPKPTICHVRRNIVTVHKRPVAEIAPQVKQSNSPKIAVAPSSKDESTKKEKGMFILKPEEINKRLMQSQVPTNLEHLNAHQSGSDTGTDAELEMDIESFLATAEECEAPNDDVLIISDDEMDGGRGQIHWKDVWIECKSIEGLGWIRGRKNNQGSVSFEFPGFNYTEFYKQEEAFTKLTQVLSRKIYIPKSIHLEWHVVETEKDLRATRMLTQEELGPDFVMTKRGIQHKQELLLGKLLKKEIADDSGDSNPRTENDISDASDNEEEPMDIASLEAASQQLEQEGEELLKTFKSSASHAGIDQGLTELEGMREEIAARLQSMVADT